MIGSIIHIIADTCNHGIPIGTKLNVRGGTFASDDGCFTGEYQCITTGKCYYAHIITNDYSIDQVQRDLTNVKRNTDNQQIQFDSQKHEIQQMKETLEHLIAVLKVKKRDEYLFLW